MPPALPWLAGSAAGLLAWGLAYSQLVPVSDGLAGLLPLQPGSPLAEAARFFLYDAPKVLLLLTLVVFGMGVVRSFFSAERTRALLAGRREGVGNVLAALLGVVTPFCSCSAVPMFIGFVSAGVPLGVTFSFLIAAPMVNEIALGLLFALVGWKVALLYLGVGLGIAIAAGWVIGRLHLEHWLEAWVRDLRSGAAGASAGGADGRRPGARRAGGDARHRRPGLALDAGRHRRWRLHPRLRADRRAGVHDGRGVVVVGAGRRGRSASRCIRTPRASCRSPKRCSAKGLRWVPCSPS